MTPVYQYASYVKYLKDDIAANDGLRGYQRKLADAADCAAPYLSSVLRGKCHLLPDHAHGLCRFWRFDAAQEDFFMLLLHHARASKATYRSTLEARIKAKRQEQKSLVNRATAATRLADDEALHYYRHWSIAAVHVATSVPELQTPSALASALLLPMAAVQDNLARLVAMGLVERVGQRYQRTTKNLHVPSDSPFNAINHINWRNKIAADSVLGSNEGFNYSAVFAVSRSDYERIRQELYAMFDRLQSIVAPSKEETLGALCLDLSPLTRTRSPHS